MTLRAVFLPVILCLVFVHCRNSAAEERMTESQIVGKILSVDYVEEEILPPNLVVTVVGEVPTAGYSKTVLLRVVYVVPPADGIQDYILFSTPPAGPAAQVISQVTGKDTWKGYRKEAPWIKGIRVRGLGAGIVVKMLPKK